MVIQAIKLDPNVLHTYHCVIIAHAPTNIRKDPIKQNELILTRYF